MKFRILTILLTIASLTACTSANIETPIAMAELPTATVKPTKAPTATSEPTATPTEIPPTSEPVYTHWDQLDFDLSNPGVQSFLNGEVVNVELVGGKYNDGKVIEWMAPEWWGAADSIAFSLKQSNPDQI